MKPGHWVVQCPLVHAFRTRFPDVALEGGCEECGIKGHVRARCPRRKKPCTGCGDVHAVSYCTYSRKPITWHEFVAPQEAGVNLQSEDVRTLWSPEQLDLLAEADRYYVNPADGKVTWEKPLEVDTVLWHCDRCRHFLPASVDTCTRCGSARGVRPRMVRKPAVAAVLDDVAKGGGDNVGGDGLAEPLGLDDAASAAAVTVVNADGGDDAMPPAPAAT